MDNLKLKLKLTKDAETKEKLSRRIVLIDHHGEVFPKKTAKIQLVVKKIEQFYIKEMLKDNFKKYTLAVEHSDMTTLKALSKMIKLDLCKLNGYNKYVCDTEDQFLDETIEKLYQMYYDLKK